MLKPMAYVIANAIAIAIAIASAIAIVIAIANALNLKPEYKDIGIVCIHFEIVTWAWLKHQTLHVLNAIATKYN